MSTPPSRCLALDTRAERLLVDTGADVKSLHPMDCENLDYGLLGVTSEITGIGGTSEYFRELALLTFRDVEESNFQVYHLFTDIAKPTEHNESISSLLGQDILWHWRIVHDRSSGELTFEVRLSDFRVPA